VPFTAGALYFNPPIAFMSLIPAYVVGECVVALLDNVSGLQYFDAVRQVTESASESVI